MKWSRNSLERQCALAARLGYDGIEIAPFMLGEEPHLLPAAQRTVLRRAAADAGIAIISLTSSTARARGLVLSRIRNFAGKCRVEPTEKSIFVRVDDDVARAEKSAQNSAQVGA
jgi:sugar phosphate isomerase/epimerase